MSNFEIKPLGRQWNGEMQRWEPVMNIRSTDSPALRSEPKPARKQGGDEAVAAAMMLIVFGVFFAIGFLVEKIIIPLVKYIIAYVRYLYAKRQEHKTVKLEAAPLKTEDELRAEAEAWQTRALATRHNYHNHNNKETTR